jgi:hypothetical protein
VATSTAWLAAQYAMLDAGIRVRDAERRLGPKVDVEGRLPKHPDRKNTTTELARAVREAIAAAEKE